MEIHPSIVQGAHSLFQSVQKVVITNHVNPDGDAMGSALGLAGVLEKKGFEVKVIVPNAYPHFLHWMKGNDKVLVYEGALEEAHDYLSRTDLIIHLDYNALKRSGPMEEPLAHAGAKRILIDHHQQPEDFPDVLYSDTSMSSTCEMVYHFLNNLGWTGDIGKEEAECLYTGLVTDTGNFRFSSTSPETHKVAASLLDKGVEPQEIASLVYDTNTVDRLKLLSRSLERMIVLEDMSAAIISLSAEDLEKYNFKKGDTEGFVNYGLSLSGTKLSVFLSEKEGKVKMSFRSKGSFDVNQLARKFFNGGGHINAAGGVSERPLDETIRFLKEEVIPFYSDELKSN